MNTNGESMKVVWTVVERGPGKSYWTRVGVGFVNRDGSLSLRLDAVPISGTLQVRDWEERDTLPRANDGAGQVPAPRSRAPSGTATAGPPSRNGDASNGGLA